MGVLIDCLEGRTLFAVHFLPGSPEYVDNGTTMTVSGSVAGLGNGDVTVTVTANGTATVLGRNPGGKIAPGQTQNVTLGGTETYADPKNGRVDFSVTTDEAIVTNAGLPNGKWTAVVTDVKFSDASVTISQNGQVVLSDATTF